jgi:hypothetical protein
MDNEFTVTLMLQSAESGGEFEVAPKIRSDADPAYGEVQKVLDGDHSRVIRVDRAPGSLVIFHGRNSLHRVSPVRGARTRLVAVMCYEPAPEIAGSQEVNDPVRRRLRPAEPRRCGATGLPCDTNLSLMITE